MNQNKSYLVIGIVCLILLVSLLSGYIFYDKLSSDDKCKSDWTLIDLEEDELEINNKLTSLVIDNYGVLYVSGDNKLNYVTKVDDKFSNAILKNINNEVVAINASFDGDRFNLYVLDDDGKLYIGNFNTIDAFDDISSISFIKVDTDKLFIDMKQIDNNKVIELTSNLDKKYYLSFTCNEDNTSVNKVSIVDDIKKINICDF